MPALTTKQISLHLKTVPNWSKRAQVILRTFKFAGFLKSIDYVNRIARKAQKMDHHPDIEIRFNKVTNADPDPGKQGIANRFTECMPGRDYRNCHD